VQAFLDEAALLRGLEHPHIVETLDAGTLDGQCAVAVEYLEGQSLRLVLRRTTGPDALPRELAAHIAVCVLDALQHAHEAKDDTGQSLASLHRDVSPSHVFHHQRR